MRTRNASKPKPAPVVKSPPATRKSAVKTPQKPPETPAESSATPKSSGTRRTRAIEAKNKEIQDVTTAVEEAKTLAVDETVEKTPVSGKKVTRVAKRKVVRKKTPASAKSSSLETSKPGDDEKEELSKEEEKEGADSMNEEPAKNIEVTSVNVEEADENKEVIPVNVEEPEEKKTPVELVGQSPRTEEVEETTNENKESVLVDAEECKLTEPAVVLVEESSKDDMEEVAAEPNPSVEETRISQMQNDAIATEADPTVMKDINTSVTSKEYMEAKEVTGKTEIVEGSVKATAELVDMEENTSKVLKEEELSVQADMEHEDVMLELNEVTEKAEVVKDGMDTTEPVHRDNITTGDLKEDEPFEEVGMEHEDDMIMNTHVVEDGTNTSEQVNILKIATVELQEDETPARADVEHMDENMEQGGKEVAEEFKEGVLAQDNVTEHGEKSQKSEEEDVQLTALAEDRRRKKELEIFIGGLDRDAVDEDVRKVFEHVGEVVEVQVHKDPSSSKNKGYAFVKFATKEQAKQALAEIKHPVINGKQCGTAPCEDNNTLFLGNICNTWTKEAIREKLKDYGIDGVETITLVLDPKHEGLSRGFAFVEFTCHGDAMLAYKRLQKPDVIFGHLERTAKVAFAEPLREPDPEVMAQVKSVFVDGLPPHWDESHVRKVFKGYGDIEQITLARNISSSKRKDFGFVDFSTHEAAVTCIDDINSREIGDGNSKAKVKARLSNPSPKTQAVKGEMCGGFRIGHVSSGALPHSVARGSGRGAHPSNRTNVQRGRGFYNHGRGQTSGMSFPYNRSFDEPFRGREGFVQGGRWGSSRGAHVAPGEGTLPVRFNLDRPRHGGIDRAHETHMHYRGGQPFPPEEFDRPFPERRFDDPYMYSDRPHGIKRPHFTARDPRYMEPSRVRPRLDYADPAVPFPAPHPRGTFGSGSSRYPPEYYGPNCTGGRGDIRPSFYGGPRPHRGGYNY
ncbi:uncharacterized protein LOC141717779 isoform X2 [Apium graveolens]|uniref:uncharacterized protein LOC141717779 isoform X2 n=1 Tax=Apium graveolens TaxID=4045 RepID=UPI003D7A6AF9